MRKLLLLLPIFFLASCATLPQYSEYGETAYYTKHADMFISEATEVNFEYKPLGSVSAYAISGYNGNNNFKSEYWEARSEDVLRALVREAKRKGANGIINVKIEYHNTWDYSHKMFRGSYTATGMAIRK